MLRILPIFLSLQVVDPTQNRSFAINVIALLPYMLQNYEDANALCIQSAENIAQVSFFFFVVFVFGSSFFFVSFFV